MQGYKQLTQEQRYHIWAMKKTGTSQTDIATEIGVHKSTITRELQRNTGQRGYRPKQSHDLAQRRQQERARTPRITAETWELVEAQLRQEWSPEQIAGWFKHKDPKHKDPKHKDPKHKDPKARVSHERIYQYV